MFIEIEPRDETSRQILFHNLVLEAEVHEDDAGANTL